MFKILIEGKTIKELKVNAAEFFREFEGFQPSNKQEVSQDISDHIDTALPKVPKQEAPEPARSIPSVPSPVTIPVTTPANDYGVDSRGLPWDERIHSVSQGKNKDGSWRFKRGVEEHQVKNVEAELASKMKGVQAAQMEVPSVPAPVSQSVPSPMGGNPATPPIPFTPTPIVVPTPVTPPPLPPLQIVPSAHTLKTFKDTLVPTLAKLVKEGKLTQQYLNQLCEHYKVDMLFKVNDEQLAEVFQGFVQYGLIVKAE